MCAGERSDCEIEYLTGLSPCKAGSVCPRDVVVLHPRGVADWNPLIHLDWRVMRRIVCFFFLTLYIVQTGSLLPGRRIVFEEGDDDDDGVVVSAASLDQKDSMASEIADS